MIVVAAVIGYLIGSLPTAVWLGRLWGVDLRRGGSGNPGANNARRLGGYMLAVLVLLFEMTKGLGAVVVGLAIGEEAGAVGAGLGAVAGNVYNVWYGFRGGKGLGITAGILVGIWPAMVPVTLVVLAIASALTKSTGKGTLITLAVLVLGALVWQQTGLENAWGVEDPVLLMLTAVGVSLTVARRHWHDARRRISSPARL